MSIIHRWGIRESEARNKHDLAVHVAIITDLTHPKCKIGDALTPQRKNYASWPTKQSKCQCPIQNSTFSDGIVNKVTTNHSHSNSSEYDS